MKCLLILFFLICFDIACVSQVFHEREGFVKVQGGRIWYKIIGTGKKTPLLFIHGAPEVIVVQLFQMFLCWEMCAL